MASLLGDIVFETSGQGSAPSKDFYQLIVSRKQVIWRWWKISLRIEFRGAAPGELKQSHEEFMQDTQLQHQVGVVFGLQTLEYTQALCNGHFDYLNRLPDDLLLHIISFLSFQDIGQLSQTSKTLQKLCNSEEFWEQTVRGRCYGMTEDMEMLASAMGWKRTFFTFFKDKCKPKDSVPTTP